MAEDKNIAIEVEVKGVEKSVESMKDLKNAIKSAKDEQLKAASSFGEGSKQYVDAAKKVSALKDKVDDLKDSTTSLAGSGLERAKAGISQFGEGLMNLDFGKVKAGLTALKSALASTGIMLIVMAVSYLIANFEELSKGTGLLGLVLRAVGDYIQIFIDLAYKLTDALGLTNSALDATREAMVNNAEKAKEALGEQTKEYDRLIAVAKSNGESTVQIELQKQRAIQATNEMILRQMLAQVKSGVELDEAQKKLLTSTLASVKDTHTAITVIENTDRKDRAEKNNKAYEDNKAANIAMIKQIEDAKIAAIKDEEQRAFAKETLDNQRRVKDIEASKASSDLKNQMLLANEQLFQDNINAINLTAKAKKDAIDAKVIADKAIADKKILDDAKIALDNKNKDDIAGAQLKVAQDGEDVNAKINLLAVQKDIELQNANLTANEKLLINQKYENDVTALKKAEGEKQAEDEKKSREESFAKAQNAVANLQALSDAFFTFKRLTLKKGSAEELAAAKKQFNINKALAITTATIQGVQGVLAAFSSGAAVPVVGAVLGPAYAVLAGVVAAANIAKIASAKFDEGGGGGGGGAVTSGGATPSVPIPSPPTLNTPGANTNSGTTFDSTGKNTSATTPTINVNATIGVDEINSKQNRVSVLEKQSTF
jgi:hypothetical protein